jgi:serine/arginine repetitive matrix protein 2
MKKLPKHLGQGQVKPPKVAKVCLLLLGISFIDPELDPFLSTGSRSATPDWRRQLDEVDKVLHARIETAAWSMDESRSELGIFARMADDEDHTITLRRPRHHSSVSPPPIPTSRLPPNSPTASEFSVPRTLKGSVYSATGLLAYRSTPSVGSHMKGVSSHTAEAHRPRRRLKKKQRPVGMNLLNDSGVYEPEERIAEGEEQELPPRGRSKSRPTTPSPEALPTLPPQSPNSRSSLKMLSRLNSVKKWRQRASTGPSEVIATEESKRPSTPNRPRSNSWFHKHTSPVLKAYKSKEQLRAVDEQTPKVRGNRSRSNTTGTIPRMPSASANDLLKGRDTPDVHRPFSMQPQARAVFPVSDVPQSPESQVTRSSSIRIKAQTTPRDAALPNDDKEGRRGLMGNVRRLSFGKHKRARSTAEAGVQYSPPPKEAEGAVERSGSAIFSMIRPSQELSGTRPSTPAPLTNGVAPKTPVRQVQLQVPAPTSPQPGSLGRYATPNGAATPASLRRCSMGDLKIPSRISQAQDGIKRDLSLVKEFAACVESEFFLLILCTS